MTLVKLNINAYEPVGSTITAFGHSCEVREDGVYANIDDTLVDIYKTAGRILEVAKEVVKEPAKEVEQSAAVVVEQGSGNRVGRPKKAD